MAPWTLLPGGVISLTSLETISQIVCELKIEAYIRSDSLVSLQNLCPEVNHEENTWELDGLMNIKGSQNNPLINVPIRGV